MADNTKIQSLPLNTEMPPSNTSCSTTTTMDKDRELQELREQLARSQARLSHLSEAQRLLAAQIRQADLSAHPIKKVGGSSDDQTIATDCDTVLSEDDNNNNNITNNRAPTCSAHSVDPTELRLCQITDQLTQSQTADLLALQNAAHMLQEHARLASQEAVEAVHDAVQAQGCLEEWKRRAMRAERKCMALHSENVNLKANNEKLAAERRVLIKEVRKMRKAQTEKQGHWQQFESYILGAMNMHEQRLKKCASKDTVDDLSTYSSDEGATVTLKTDKLIHVESAAPRQTPPALPECNPDKDDDDDDECAFVPVSSNDASHSSKQNNNRPLKKLSSLGGGLANGLGNYNRAVRKQVQRTLAKASGEKQLPGTPPKRINVYPSDCVSPVMSYDSVDGVWSIEDSNHSKSSLVDAVDLDKECSGCASLQDSS